MVVVIVNFDACAGLVTMTPSPVASKATPPLAMWATSVKCASLRVAWSGLLRISEAVGGLAGAFAAGAHAVIISTPTASVAPALVFTSPILVDGRLERDPGLDQVRFLEDHDSGGQRRWRDDFLDGEDRLDQFRGGRARLKSLDQSRPDPGPPNEATPDLGQDRWRDDFLDGEDRLDQFRGGRARLKSLDQSRPDPGPPNEATPDLG